MLLHNLPEDILATVLRRCVVFCGEPVCDLKDNLPLLAVCRLWRRLAIPLLYRHVFIQYGDTPKRRNGPITPNLNVEEPTGVVVRTNLGLIDMVGFAGAVKSVQIKVFCLVNPLPGWREVIQRVLSVARKWRAVYLWAMIHTGFAHYDDRDVDMDKYTDDITKVGDALAVLMPGLRHLICESVNQNPITRSLYGHMASRYADQLQRLFTRHPITVPPGCQFTGLKKIRIGYEGVADYQLPQMASRELVDMTLAYGPANHSWAPFRADNSSRVIEFTKLERLFVGYLKIHQENGVAVRHRDGHPWQLQFPSLRRLRIFCSRDICPLLEYAVLPPRMESISIELRSDAYLGIADLVLPATKHLSLRIEMQSLGDPSGLPVINRMFESARGSESLELVVKDCMLQVEAESITCTALTHLSVSAPTTVDTMLAIIEKLPNLVQLTYLELDLSDIQADISVPGPDADAAVEPLSQSLKGLAINYERRRLLPDTAVAVAKYMLLRIPSLTAMLAAQTPESPVVSFVDEYASRYPHLSGVELALDEGGGSEDLGYRFFFV